MNKTPNSNRVHIGIFGKTNSGKSTIFNKIIGDDISIISDIKGTTTDTVKKAMEFIPYGPVLFLDTAGFEDESILGKLREEKTNKELKNVDIAVLVIDSQEIDTEFIQIQKIFYKKYNINYILVFNKVDLIREKQIKRLKEEFPEAIFCSGLNENIKSLKEKIGEELSKIEDEPTLIGDIINYGSKVVIVIPIDSEAPKGRLILPQVQLLRDCLDNGIKSYVVRDTELKEALEDLSEIDLVITDSQIFKKVDMILNNRSYLTSFSILFARQKGELKTLIDGAKKLKELKDNDKILIVESCTHTTSHEDIGRIKLPKMIKNYTNKDIEFDFISGKGLPDNLSQYSLIIHCGGCMITRKMMKMKLEEIQNKGIPITNYGIVIAEVNGILEKAINIFKKE